ncbi:hypothetical protein ADN00_15895 [Ornatilinea apprima]|uniref:Peptidase C11 clostripain n=1 Tax=Ornatilinea apprima TaxID=1134406 RepID=A0A0N8GLA9_9CHLR|nr:clostripain-related cysteine peptidase [Ornatilinea apprima]KPL71986.1 hypothetical protein ADN00_15895 [Ornatilinea apprima]
MKPLYRWILSLTLLVAMIGGLTACDENLDYEEWEYEPAAGEVQDEEDYSQDEQAEADQRVGAALEPAGDGSWLVMLYQDADDETLEEDIFTDLNEAERVGSSDMVQIVAQIDRYEDGFDGDGDWSETRRYYLTADEDLSSIQSEEVENLGEVNMADGEVLKDFVLWAMSEYPADHYALILSDHGTGWPGGWSDPEPANDPDAMLVDGFDDMLYLNEITAVLAEVQAQTGLEKFDLIGMDACLMGSLEVFSALAPYAEYAVASQETEPAMGWAYTAVLEGLNENPAMGGSGLAELIVDTYIDSDSMIIDPDMRAIYLERAYDTDEDISPAALAREEKKSVTLTAVDLARVADLNASVDEMARILSDGINQKVVARARSHAQSFESVFGDDEPSPYIDLGHFVKLLKKESTSERVAAAADAIRAAIDDAVLAEKHGDEKKGATGISIYFPNSGLFEMEGSDYQTYVHVAGDFTNASLWDEFLVYHYTGEPLSESAAPEKQVTAPGAEVVEMTEMEVSGDTASVGEPVTISTTVMGERVGYLYVFTGILGDETGNVYILDIDYLDSDTTKEEDGVIYPDWGDEGEIEIEFDWEPVQFAITDGETYIPALLEPDAYGASLEETSYTVDGYYTFNGGDTRYARLYFSGEGFLYQVMVFSGMEDRGAMAEVIPDEGDTFTVFEQWIESGEDGEVTYWYAESDSLTFGEEPITWDFIEAPVGDYVVGLLVEDLDGNQYEQYVTVSVE